MGETTVLTGLLTLLRIQLPVSYAAYLTYIQGKVLTRRKLTKLEEYTSKPIRTVPSEGVPDEPPGAGPVTP